MTKDELITQLKASLEVALEWASEVSDENIDGGYTEEGELTRRQQYAADLREGRRLLLESATE